MYESIASTIKSYSLYIEIVGFTLMIIEIFATDFSRELEVSIDKLGNTSQQRFIKSIKLFKPKVFFELIFGFLGRVFQNNVSKNTWKKMRKLCLWCSLVIFVIGEIYILFNGREFVGHIAVLFFSILPFIMILSLIIGTLGIRFMFYCSMVFLVIIVVGSVFLVSSLLFYIIKFFNFITKGHAIGGLGFCIGVLGLLSEIL